jgi:hypothetical protein
LAGLVALRRGHMEKALHLLERSLEACRDKQLTVWQPITSSLLGLTRARVGRPEDGLLRSWKTACASPRSWA